MYREDIRTNGGAVGDFPNYMPLPDWVTTRTEKEICSDRSSNCSDDSALDSENGGAEILLSESDGDELDMDPF